MTTAHIILTETEELNALVKSFFEDYLDYQEESDSGRVFNPIHSSCTRALMTKPLVELLDRMKKLSGAKESAEKSNDTQYQAH